MCNSPALWRCALSLILLAASSLAACGDGGGKGEGARDAGDDDAESEGPNKGEPGEPNEEDAGGGGDQPSNTKGKGKLRARVTYADGTAVGQVDLRVAGKTYKSDSRGVFTIDEVDEGDQELVIEGGRVTRAQTKVKVSKDRTVQAELSVMPLKDFKLSDVSAGGEVSDIMNPGFKVALKGGSLRSKRTKEATKGEAQARYAVAKESRDLRAAPGTLKGQMGTREVQLESFGIAELRFLQKEGEQEEELELSEPADVALPLGPNSFTDKQEIDAWVFDGEMGIWKQEGKATVDKSAGGNGVAKVAASRPAWWTVGRQLPESTCISGRLLAADGAPLANGTVEAIGVNYWGTFSAFTGDDGGFCLSVKPGQNTTLKAFGLSGSSYFEWRRDVVAGSVAALCGGGGCTDAGSIMGESLFDECTGDVTSDQNHVLLLSSGDPMLDSALEMGLEQLGHTATVGVSYDLFDGKIDLSPYDAVYLQSNYNWLGRDMPLPGQRQLINWVNCGGGLVTTEWTTWKIGSGGFQMIDAIFPAARTTAYGSPSPVTYTQVTAEPTLNRGLSAMLTFMTTSYGGTESFLTPRAGATIYYASQPATGTPPTNPYSGLLGWPYNLGRVATFSTTIGSAQVADATFVRLIGNTIDWVQRD